jgi:putative heme iron utilization protein
MLTVSDNASLARRLLNHQDTGVLSTNSRDVEGYPFGSIAPYVLDHGGAPCMLLSDIAQHTRNIVADPRVSLTVFDRRADDPQASGRLTWIGRAARVDETDTARRERYRRYFPWSESYFEMHDFALYWIEPVRARFIGGFGQIFWVEPAALLVANPFRDTEDGIIAHMNGDHRRALARYCELLGEPAADDVAMTGIDDIGFDMRVGRRKLRMDFDAPIRTIDEARAALVALAGR